MDSNFNPCELNSPKIELETDDRIDFSYTRLNKPHWNSENTMKLIFVLENECKELWDIKNPLHKDKNVRQSRHEYLAEVFGTTAEEIVRKLHNLRTQLNHELRKIKRKQTENGDGTTPTSGWEYFDAMSFIVRQHAIDVADPLNVEGINLEPGANMYVRKRNITPVIPEEVDKGVQDLRFYDSVVMFKSHYGIGLAEFQADEEIQFGARVKAAAAAIGSPKTKTGRTPRVAASAPPPLPPSAHPSMWPEQPLPRPRPGVNADECQIFGDFVASELRTLRSEGSRRRLKRIIQKAILQVGEEEDGGFVCG